MLMFFFTDSFTFSRKPQDTMPLYSLEQKAFYKATDTCFVCLILSRSLPQTWSLGSVIFLSWYCHTFLEVFSLYFV